MHAHTLVGGILDILLQVWGYMPLSRGLYMYMSLSSHGYKSHGSSQD